MSESWFNDFASCHNSDFSYHNFSLICRQSVGLSSCDLNWSCLVFDPLWLFFWIFFSCLSGHNEPPYIELRRYLCGEEGEDWTVFKLYNEKTFRLTMPRKHDQVFLFLQNHRNALDNDPEVTTVERRWNHKGHFKPNGYDIHRPSVHVPTTGGGRRSPERLAAAAMSLLQRRLTCRV